MTVDVAVVDPEVLAVDVRVVLPVVLPVEVTVDVSVVYSQSRNRPSSHESIAVFIAVTSSSAHLVFKIPNGIWHEKAAAGGPRLFPRNLKEVTMAFKSLTTALQSVTLSNVTELFITENDSSRFGFVPKF